MEESNYFKQIEAYETGKMSVDERKSFEQSLQTDEDLKVVYEAYQASKQVLDLLAYETLKELPDMDAKMVSISTRKWWLIAAGILFVVVAGMLWWQVNDKTPDLIADYYVAPLLDVERGEDLGDNKLFIDFYEENYSAVLQTIRQLNAPSLEQQLLLAHAYLKTERLQQAIDTYSTLVLTENEYTNVARWHRMLAYFELNQQQQAEAELKYFIDDTTNVFHEKALKLSEIQH